MSGFLFRHKQMGGQAPYVVRPALCNHYLSVATAVRGTRQLTYTFSNDSQVFPSPNHDFPDLTLNGHHECNFFNSCFSKEFNIFR